MNDTRKKNVNEFFFLLIEVNETTKGTKKEGKKSQRVSLKSAATQHLCLLGSKKKAHATRHHSCKMSSGASSNSKILILIHKQLPLSLCCCRFRTAVPPNISLLFLANTEKKKKLGSTSAFTPQKKKRKTQERGSERLCETKEDPKRQKRIRAGEKKVQYLAFYVNEIAG